MAVLLVVPRLPKKIGEIMGVSVGSQEKKVAFVKCAGTCEKAKTEYQYTGVQDCSWQSQMQDGEIEELQCRMPWFRLLRKACPFDAIHVVDGIATVDKEVCRPVESVLPHVRSI